MTSKRYKQLPKKTKELKAELITSIDDLADSEFLKVEVSFLQSPFNQDFYLIYKDE